MLKSLARHAAFYSQRGDKLTEELAKTEKAPPVIKVGERGLEISSFEDMWYFAGRVADSGLAPKDMQRKETIVIALQKGYELGLKPMQSLQNIAVINGRATVWGDALAGIIRASGKCEFINSEEIGTKPTGTDLKKWPDDFGFKVSSKRTDTGEEQSATFTVADAKIAGLWEKPSVWNKYPKRMLLNRPRSYCLRDLYSDVLGGIYTAEEMQDVGMAGKEDVIPLDEAMEIKMQEAGLETGDETPVDAVIDSPRKELPESGDSATQPGLFDQQSMEKDRKATEERHSKGV
ncbi:hypothetical protein LCGC14_2307940 [marine sediment metagenome]|uniref:RecT family protein n=1 Tax=marine sediment metagenome TaxID=412755 RepID=A0A0F9FGD3_9ZZZZ